MRNRCKTLLRDHSVPEVTLKACPKHYSVSAIPETLTVRGPKRPPTRTLSCCTPMYVTSTSASVWPVLIVPTNCIGTVTAGTTTWRPITNWSLIMVTLWPMRLTRCKKYSPQCKKPSPSKVSSDSSQDSSSDSSSLDTSTKEEDKPTASQRDPYTNQ